MELLAIRTLTDDERKALEAGLRSPDAFILRRCQTLLASDRGEHALAIACHLGSSHEAVREAIHSFNRQGLAVFEAHSHWSHMTSRVHSPGNG